MNVSWARTANILRPKVAIALGGGGARELCTSWPWKLLTKWRFPPWRSRVRLWAPLSVPRMRRELRVALGCVDEFRPMTFLRFRCGIGHDSSGLRPNQGPEPMSTKMDEDDWAHTLAVFRACLPRRGRKAEDDRRFLEALHFFTVENVRWRALPERFGHWNSVWKRFDRLSKAGVFEAFFDTLASMSSTAHLIQMFDSTVVRAHVSAAGAKGGKKARRSDIRAAASPRKSTQNRTPPATSSPSI